MMPLNSEILDNPLLIMSSTSSFTINDSNNLLQFYSSNKKWTQDAKTREISSSSDFCSLSNINSLILNKETNQYYLYSQGSQYLISLSDDNCQSKSISNIGISETVEFIGSIYEGEFINNDEGNAKINLRCSLLSNEIIIYGKSDTKINFYYVEKKINIQLDTSCSIEDNFRCIKIDNSVYICAYICSYEITIHFFAYVTSEDTSSSCEIKSIYSRTINPSSSYTNLMMIENLEENKLLICAKNVDSGNIECYLANYRYNEYEVDNNSGDGENNNNDNDNGDEGQNESGNNAISNSFNAILEYEQNPVFTLVLETDNNNECVFKNSYRDEYLLCCGGVNIIKCGKINSEFEVDSFTLTLEGTITHLDFIISSEYIHLIYINNLNSGKNIYEYSFYIPVCTDKIYSTIPLGTFSDNLINLFTKKIDSNYYFKFVSFPSNYGTLKLNDELLDQDLTSVQKILITDNDVFNFTSTSADILNDLEIIYEVFTEEGFSNICSAQIDIQPCYDSCYLCTKSKSESDSENHNCVANNCKENHYQAPDIETNCFQELERKSNWYLDNSLEKFAFCDENCGSCNGPSDEDCLSCNSDTENKYLYNKKCLTECPDGYYPELQYTQYYKCKDCYTTCETCSANGNRINMYCITCKPNSIMWNNNCFQIKDPTLKTFILPWDDSISNCFLKYGYYIKEDSDICISGIPEGYYLSNEDTGVVSPCHPDCKTCNEKYIEGNTKCILCKNEDLNFFQGNCIANCPDGYYSKAKSETNIQKSCEECYYTCKKCSQGQTYDSNNKLENMNCNECKQENSNDIYIKVNNNCFKFVNYEEDKIKFDISLINSNPYEKIKTCYDYDLTILYGEYECKSKPTNSYYIVNGDENTGVIKYCDVSCATCNEGPDTETGDTNCQTCSSGYYKTEDSSTNCILESLIPENYYKYTEDNIFYKCYSLCVKCVHSLNYKTSIDNMGCSTCVDNYYIAEGTNNCYDISFLDTHKNYYLSEEEGEFKKCYFSCEECSTGYLNENNHNCDKCLENYFYEDGTKNCFDLSVTENGYYFDNFTINVDLGESPVFKKCYYKCKTCSNYLIEDDMNCILCAEGYFKLSGTNNCIDDITNKGYYQINGIAYPCEDNCLTCFNGKAGLTENNLNNNLEIITEITNNCLSCDEQNKNLFLVENINNCVSEDFISNGFYLELQGNNQKVFKKCYQSCSLCIKYMEIDPISNEENHNCEKCATGYYRLLDDPLQKNCYGNEMIDKGYRLVRNFWQICHENCGECSSAPTDDSHNCITCYTGYNFVYQTNNCENETFEEQGYYLDDNDHFYKKCDITCKTCDKYSNTESPKCKKCNSDKNYYKAEKKPEDLCYNISNIGDEYVLSERYDEDGNAYKIWSFCYELCTTCSKFGNSEDDQGCTSCINKYYLIYNSSNCVTDNYAINNGYYFNYTFLKYVKCDKSCINCFGAPNEETTNCKKCNNDEGYYSVEGKTNSLCYSEETVPEGYFLDRLNQPYKWYQCYETCARCQFKGDNIRMRCLSCRTNLKNNLNKTKYFLLIEDNCIEACENNLFLTKDGDCVTECPIGTYKYILNYNYSCLESCPPDYIISPDGKECIIPEFPFDATISSFKSIISKNIIQYMNATKIIDLNQFKARIISSNDFSLISNDTKQLYVINNIENILNQIKIANNLESDEDIIITMIEYKETSDLNKNLDINKDKINLGKNLEILLYDSSGNKLIIPNDINDEFEIKKYIGNLAYINFEESKSFYEKDIDVFDENDSFFNDICYPFKTEYDSDIAIEDRRKYFFKIVDFCGKECSYNKIDYELMNVNCICGSSIINNDNSIDNSITLNNRIIKFKEELYSTNLVLMKCGNLVFDAEIIKNNIGFIFNIILISIELIFFLLFIKNGLKYLKNLVLIFEPKETASPPKLKEIMALTQNKKEKTKEEEIQKSKLINHLITAKKKKKFENEKNIADDALVIDYNDNINEGNKESLKKKDKIYNKIKEKIAEHRNEDDEDENSENINEKKTGLKRTNNEKKKRILFNEDYIEEITNIKDNNNKQNHPLDYIITNNPMDNDLLDKHMKLGNIHKSNYLYLNKNTEKADLKSDNKKQENNYIKESKNKKEKNIERKYGTEKGNYLNTKYHVLIMDYEEAINSDKRKFLEMYLSYLIEHNFILNTILSDSFINSIPIKLSYLSFRLIVIFALNALFYSDKYISLVFGNEGKLNFFSSLPKAIYSLLITILISALLKLLLNNREKIIRLISNKDRTDFFSIMNKALKDIKNKLIAYYIIEFSISLFCLYYCSAFCAVYQNSKIFWFYGCLETILFDFIFSVIICFFITTFRYEGIQKRIKCFYIMAKGLNYL